MAEVLLFHHAQGLTPGCLSFADRLRAAGHVVHAPDLYDGETFDNLKDGVAHAEEVGFDAIMLNEHHGNPFCMGSVMNVEAQLAWLPAGFPLRKECYTLVRDESGVVSVGIPDQATRCRLSTVSASAVRRYQS